MPDPQPSTSPGAVRTVLAGDTRFLLRAEGEGTGVPVLLLHGVPETSTLWHRVAPQLADGRRVLAPDLPGLGGSSFAGPYDVVSLARQLAALVEQEVPGGRVDVVGHDWGGVLALALTGERPDLVRRLCVANAPYRTLPLHKAVHVPFLALPVLPELLFRFAGRRVVESSVRRLWHGSTPPDADVLAEYSAAYTVPASLRAMLGYYRHAARSMARGRASRLLRPQGERPAVVGAPVSAESVLVLWGALDEVLPISVGEAVVKDLGPDTVLVTVPDAGHFVVAEQPEHVVALLREFLAPEPRPPFVPPASRRDRED